MSSPWPPSTQRAHVLDGDAAPRARNSGSAPRRARRPCRPPCLRAGRTPSAARRPSRRAGWRCTMTNAFGAVLLDALRRPLHDRRLMRDEIVAAHARLARHAGGDDDDVGAGDVGLVVGAGDRGVEADDRRRSARGRAPCPAASPSGMSNRTTSPSSFMPTRWASSPPMLPAPMSAIFLRAMLRNPRAGRVRV